MRGPLVTLLALALCAAPASLRAEQEQEKPPRKMVSLLVLDTIDQGAGADRAEFATGLLKRSLLALDHIEVLGAKGLSRLSTTVPGDVSEQLLRAESLVRRGHENLLNLSLEEAIEAFQSARVKYRRHLAWLEDPEPLILALMGLAEAMATAGQRDAASMAYREVLNLSPYYEPDPGQVPTKLRSLFDQVREAVAREPTGKLAVEVEPRGCSVVVDGLTAGKSPLVRGDLPSGLHMVLIRKKGYRPLRKVVEVTAGETVRVEGSLKRLLVQDLIRRVQASLASSGDREEPVALARDLARITGLPGVVLSQLIEVEGQPDPILTVALIPASGKPCVLAARLGSSGAEQVGGTLAWQIADALEEGSPPVPPPASLGLDFVAHLLGRPRPLHASIVVRLPEDGDVPGDQDEKHPGPVPRPGDPPPPPPPDETSIWDNIWGKWWFWTGAGAVVVGGLVTTLALTLQANEKTISEPDRIFIQVLRKPIP